MNEFTCETLLVVLILVTVHIVTMATTTAIQLPYPHSQSQRQTSTNRCHISTEHQLHHCPLTYLPPSPRLPLSTT